MAENPSQPTRLNYTKFTMRIPYREMIRDTFQDLETLLLVLCLAPGGFVVFCKESSVQTPIGV